jgi:arylsulfatase
VLKNPKATWPERLLVHHVGRWAKGKAAQSKYANCAIQNSRFTLINNDQLYDLKTDPGETKNVISQHPEVVVSLRAAYDKWWSETLPLLVNESALGPQINPMKELYWKQFGGGPDAKMLEKMNPASDPTVGAEKTGKRQVRKKSNLS